MSSHRSSSRSSRSSPISRWAGSSRTCWRSDCVPPAAESGDAVRRDRRAPGPRSRDGEPRRAPRRAAAYRTLRAGPPLDRVPHGVPRTPAGGDDAQALYRTVFPRRRYGIGGRAPAVRRVPECRLQELSRALARCARRLRIRRRPRAAIDGAAWLVLDDALVRWSDRGYDARRARSSIDVEVLTPPSLVVLLGAGYAPAFHPTALTAGYAAG